MSDMEEIGNHKGGPQIEFMVGDESVLLRPYVYGWEICWKRKVKDRNNPGQYTTIWSGEKFFTNLTAAMSGLFEYQLRACDATTLMELRDQMVFISENLTKVWITKLKGAK